MPLNLVTPPTVEPITTQEARAQLLYTAADQDSLIDALISAARARAEAITGRSLCTQTWELTLDSFPGPSLYGVPYGRAYSVPAHAILLEKPPIQSITSIKYLALDGSTQTMAPADYVDATAAGVKPQNGVTRITPVFGKIWPIPMPQIGAVSVIYVAGYGGQGTVPPDIIAWMKMRIGALFINREEIVVGSRITVAPLPIDDMLDPHTIRMF